MLFYLPDADAAAGGMLTSVEANKKAYHKKNEVITIITTFPSFLSCHLLSAYIMN